MSNEHWTPGRVLAYFSHSYNPKDKLINLAIWEQLTHNLQFMVDQKSDTTGPMNVTYLEFLMARSRCFVAVIPRRKGLPMECSPYQWFENRLAVRFRKPRLLFLEGGLSPEHFSVKEGSVEVAYFQRPDEFDLDHEYFDYFNADKKLSTVIPAAEQSKLDRLVERARGEKAINEPGQEADQPKAKPKKPIAFLFNSGKVYSKAVSELKKKLSSSAHTLREIPLSGFDKDHLFINDLRGVDMLICDIRNPYMRPDIFGLVHAAGIPVFRVAYLKKSEKEDTACTAMRLPLNSTSPTVGIKNWPILLSGFQIDAGMEPVLFWNDAGDLAQRLSNRIQHITDQWDNRATTVDPRKYFLQIGRFQGKKGSQIFLSNERSQNHWIEGLRNQLERHAVNTFHYMDIQKMRANIPNWRARLEQEMKSQDTLVFVAIICKDYMKSDECRWELEFATQLYRAGQIELHAYRIDPDAEIPKVLAAIDKQVVPLDTQNKEEKITYIGNQTIQFLESGWRVTLDPRLRTAILDILKRYTSELDSDWADFIQNLYETVPQEKMRKLLAMPAGQTLSLEIIVDRLATWEHYLEPGVTALGLFIANVMEYTHFDDQLMLADVIRRYNLLPDIKRKIETSPCLREIRISVRMNGLEVLITNEKEATPVEIDNKDLLQYIGSLAGSLLDEPEKWTGLIAKIGSTMLPDSIKQLLAKLYSSQHSPSPKTGYYVGLLIESDSYAGLPWEWATIGTPPVPLCWHGPVRRELIGQVRVRTTVRELLDGATATPLKVLIVGANTGGLNEVNAEIENVRNRFEELFQEVRWPKKNVKVLKGQDATDGRIEKALINGNYHLLHFAGHGTDIDSEAGLAVFNSKNKQTVTNISATTLRDWLKKSNVRFVYLGSCSSAEAKIPSENVLRKFDSALQGVLDAGVPEVVGFRWPIRDGEGRKFAEGFYEEYTKHFDSSVAVYEALRAFQDQDAIWPAPVVFRTIQRNAVKID